MPLCCGGRPSRGGVFGRINGVMAFINQTERLSLFPLGYCCSGTKFSCSAVFEISNLEEKLSECGLHPGGDDSTILKSHLSSLS